MNDDNRRSTALRAPIASLNDDDDREAAEPALAKYNTNNYSNNKMSALPDGNNATLYMNHNNNNRIPLDDLNNGTRTALSEPARRNSQARPAPLAPRPEKRSWIYENLILILTIAGVLSGVLLGIILKVIESNRGSHISDDWIQIIKFPGELLMRMLKCLIVPLISASLISGLAQLDITRSAVIGKRALIYYFVTTAVAVVLGIVLVLIIHPGDPNIKREVGDIQSDQELSTLDAFLDLIRNLFPDNIVQAAFMTQSTRYSNKTVRVKGYPPDGNNNNNYEISTSNQQQPYYTEIRRVRRLSENYGINMLGLIVFCICFGTVLTRMGSRGQVVVDFFTVVNDITMQLVMIVVWYSPIGIASLIAGKIIEVTDLVQMAIILGWYMATVMLGLLIHALIILPAIFYLTTRKNPFLFMKNMLQAWLMALATASSSATMPFTFHCLEAKNNVDMRVSRFVIPIGATVNMDGTALYEAVAAIFIGQINGMSMNLGKVITVSVTATLASVGAASIPSAGLITMMVVLSSIGLPVQDISLIVAVDWLLDRFRTSVNVLGDAFGAGIVDHLSKKELREMDEQRIEQGYDTFADLNTTNNNAGNNNNTTRREDQLPAKVVQ